MKNFLKSKTGIFFIVLFSLFVFFSFLNFFTSKRAEKNPISENKNLPSGIPSVTPLSTIAFTPIPKINLPNFTPIPEETVRKYYEDLDKKTFQDFPLFDYIPYKTENYSVDYIKPMVLEVILKQNTPEARQEVLEWIKSKGVDPKTHTIFWKVQ